MDSGAEEMDIYRPPVETMNSLEMSLPKDKKEIDPEYTKRTTAAVIVVGTKKKKKKKKRRGIKLEVNVMKKRKFLCIQG